MLNTDSFSWGIKRVRGIRLLEFARGTAIKQGNIRNIRMSSCEQNRTSLIYNIARVIHTATTSSSLAYDYAMYVNKYTHVFKHVYFTYTLMYLLSLRAPTAYSMYVWTQRAVDERVKGAEEADVHNDNFESKSRTYVYYKHVCVCACEYTRESVCAERI